LTSSDYVDATVVNGTTYYYVVTAVDTSGDESPFSAEVVPVAPSGRFVAVATTGHIASSDDGITWTQRASGAGLLRAVTFDNGMYVAVGDAGVVYTSLDGLAWVSRTPATTDRLNDVIWDGSQFLAVPLFFGTTCVRSSDGITWTPFTTGSNNMGVIASNYPSSDPANIYVTGTSSTATRSTDSIAWTPTNTLQPLSTLKWNGSLFVGGGNNPGGDIVTSPDGLSGNWTRQPTSTTGGQINDLVWDGSKWVAVTSAPNMDDPEIWTSSADSVTWTQVAGTPDAGSLVGVTYYAANPTYLAVSGTAGAGDMLRSTDAATWSSVSSGVVAAWASITVKP
jgi:hypothetical protein